MTSVPTARDTLRLTWEDPGSGQESEWIGPPPVRVGRTPDNEVVLNSAAVSRQHARIERDGAELVLIDSGSSNGTFVAGQRVTRQALANGTAIAIGPFTLTATRGDGTQPTGARAAAEAGAGRDAPTAAFPVVAPPAPAGGPPTIVPPATRADEPRTVILDRPEALPSARPGPAFPPAIFQAPYVPIAALAATGLPIDETTFLAVGGGMGSFVWVDHLVIHGADPRAVSAIGLEDKPYGRYARLCQQSQIPLHERLRSNSDSCPDNIWGWPGYAVREAFFSTFQGNFGNAIQRTWQIFTEPVYADTYTPRSGDVFKAVDREAKRIGWENIWHFGRARAIRKTDDGRYVVAYSQSTPQNPSAHRLALARYVQVAVGYPGIKILPDLQRYREETGDFKTVVHAYEYHEQIYQALIRNGGTVLVRGRGIVASRILQRLYEARQQNPRIGVLHLMRSPVAQGHKFGNSQRKVIDHWEFQPFNWPKASWTGEYLQLLERAGEEERDRLLNDWGGTTTAHRKDWINIIKTGLREGWYQIRFGEVREVRKDPSGKVVTTLVGKGLIQDETDLNADFIIDCTGLETTSDAHPLLKDLVEHHGLGRNAKGRLRVANDFEVVGMDNGPARMYASGSMTLGGPHAAVDSFLGLQYAALASVQALARHRAPGVRRLNVVTSPVQWMKWAAGAKP